MSVGEEELFFTAVMFWTRLPVIIGLVLSFILVALVSLYIRVTVQCWFCHGHTKVSWIYTCRFVCPSCNQYNGFKKNGDYNKVITAMYEEERPPKRWAVNFGKYISLNGESPVNSICSRCCIKVDMKVKLLAAFVPINEKNFDSEIAAYRRTLESAYSLCSRCEVVVENRLSAINKRFGINPISIKLKEPSVNRCRSPSVISKCTRKNTAVSARRKPLKSDYRFSYGPYLVCLFVSILLWWTDLDRLFKDGSNDHLLIFAVYNAPLIEWLYFTKIAQPLLTLLGFMIQLYCVYRSRLVLLIDGISTVSWLSLFIVYAIPLLVVLPMEQKEELSVLQTLMTTLNCLVVFWVGLLPRNILSKGTTPLWSSVRSLQCSAKLQTSTLRPLIPDCSCSRSPQHSSLSFRDYEILEGKLGSLSLNQGSSYVKPNSSRNLLDNSFGMGLSNSVHGSPVSFFGKRTHMPERVVPCWKYSNGNIHRRSANIVDVIPQKTSFPNRAISSVFC